MIGLQMELHGKIADGFAFRNERGSNAFFWSGDCYGAAGGYVDDP
jgi:hypothetical protein